MYSQVPYTAVTSAVDLPLVDCIHLNAGGLNRLGRRLARLALALPTVPGALIGPRIVRTDRQPEPPDKELVRLTFSGVTGGWSPADDMAGFDVLTAAGQPHPVNHVINAFPDKRDPSAIQVRLNVPLQAGERLSYGHGLRPVCNVVDGADLPLCACEILF